VRRQSARGRPGEADGARRPLPVPLLARGGAQGAGSAAAAAAARQLVAGDGAHERERRAVDGQAAAAQGQAAAEADHECAECARH